MKINIIFLCLGTYFRHISTNYLSFGKILISNVSNEFKKWRTQKRNDKPWWSKMKISYADKNNISLKSITEFKFQTTKDRKVLIPYKFLRKTNVLKNY